MWPVRVYCAIVGGVCFRPTVPRTSWSRCLVKPRAIAMRPSPGSSLFIHAHRPINGHHSLNRLVHSISRCQTNDKISRQNRWTMTHGRYCRLLLHTLSASTTAECRSQNNTCITWTKIITNTINNENKYSSSIVNNHHGNINKICCPIYKKSADKIVEDRTCSILADKIGWFLHDTRQIFIGRFCRQIKSADFVVRLTSPLDWC